MTSPLRLLLLVLVTCVSSASAADMKLEAKLVWGTDEVKHDPNFKPVDNQLAAKLHGAFKWKNYYEITNEWADLADNKSCNLKMSNHCTLRVKNLGAPRIEVQCIGEGKQVHHGEYTLASPTWLILGGDAGNDTAWFVGLRNRDDGKKAITRN